MNTMELLSQPSGALWGPRGQAEVCIVRALNEAIVSNSTYMRGTTHRSPIKAPALESGRLTQSRRVDSYSDMELIELVRCDPPNEAALDALVARYWDALFARCYLLTTHREKALDLAQATWCRLLRNRSLLKPDGNFPAYLATVARNLFRDSYRAARRAGPLADHRLESLEAAYANESDEGLMLVETVPDLQSIGAAERTLLAIDMDRALEQLSPQLRDVLVARFIDGESCAEIGQRYGRTEQSVSGWIRAALRQMKAYLEEPAQTDDPRKIHQQKNHQL
jgi:RNA polymerase sigma-70 factor, ECF subfamily